MTETIERRRYSIPVPERMQGLPTDPRTRHVVPWFVAEMPDGSFEFRGIGAETIDGVLMSKVSSAVMFNKCWLCGQWMGGGDKWFAVGPMCCVNRTSSEPQSHYECAHFAVMTCPFLTSPRAERREAGMPTDAGPPGGIMIPRNPGVTLLWKSRRWARREDGRGGYVFDIGEPAEWEWWSEGRMATRPEVLAAIDSGIPLLRKIIDQSPNVVTRHREHAELNESYKLAVDHFIPDV